MEKRTYRERMQAMALSGLVCVVACALQCQKDYNPFENIANAQIHVSPEACSPRIRDNDTLAIFTTETLAVYATVREKIDSIVVRADDNRLWKENVLLPPFTSGNYLFPLSFSDTGLHTVTATAYRENNTVSMAGPFGYYVRSPLKQDDIFSAYGVPVVFSTPPVGDDDVYYWWSFGTALGDTILPSPFNHIESQHPALVAIGVKKTGYLWVTDTAGKFPSSASTFSYEFYRPAAPVIKCTNKGLRGDTVVSGDTLVFSVEVIDSSGVGMRSVEINGAPVTSTDNLNYSVVYSGMKAFTATAPKTVTVTAVNNLSDSTVRTYYCYYESTGPLPELVRITLVNPTSSITTTQGSIPFIISMNKYTPDTVSVLAFQNQQALKTQIVTDSVKTLVWVLILQPGRDTITAQAQVRNQNYADTSIVITRDAAYRDTTPPQILIITINGKVYTENPFVLARTEQSVVLTVTAFDNESGVASVALVNGNKSVPMTYNLNLLSWISNSIPFQSSGPGPSVNNQMYLTLTVKNNAGKSTVKYITIVNN
jgi:hypothetical protein